MIDLEVVVPQLVKILQYADDVVLYIYNESTNFSVNRLNSAMESITNHLISLGLTLSTNKTKFCIFDAPGKYSNHSNRYISVNNDRINPSSQVRFLGIILQANLKWRAQIDKVIKGCMTPLKILSCTRRV